MLKLQRSQSQERGSGPPPQECSCASQTTPERRVGTEFPGGALSGMPHPSWPLLTSPALRQSAKGLPLPQSGVMEVGCWLELPDWIGCCLGPATCSWMGQAPSSRPRTVWRLLGTSTHLAEEAQKPSQRVTVTLAVHPRYVTSSSSSFTSQTPGRGERCGQTPAPGHGWRANTDLTLVTRHLKWG